VPQHPNAEEMVHECKCGHGNLGDCVKNGIHPNEKMWDNFDYNRYTLKKRSIGATAL